LPISTTPPPTPAAPLLYGILRGWGGSVRAGILGVCFYMFDNLNLGEARLILIDSQLFFWLAAALFTAQRWWARQNEASLAADAFKARTGVEYDSSKYAQARDARLMTLAERAAWVVAVGVTSSCAISIKFTGLATPGACAARAVLRCFVPPVAPLWRAPRASTTHPSLLHLLLLRPPTPSPSLAAMIGLESLMAISFLRRAVSWPELLGVLATAFPLYVHHFWWHFHLGQKSGESCVW
jgi:dolichyl-phosphate-mannose--protein O-mannosyl transferase